MYRHCILGSGCDMFYLNTENKECQIMPHKRAKNLMNLNEVIEETGSKDDYLYILECSTAQENILRNNNFFLNNLAGQLILFET